MAGGGHAPQMADPGPFLAEVHELEEEAEGVRDLVGLAHLEFVDQRPLAPLADAVAVVAGSGCETADPAQVAEDRFSRLLADDRVQLLRQTPDFLFQQFAHGAWGWVKALCPTPGSRAGPDGRFRSGRRSNRHPCRLLGVGGAAARLSRTPGRDWFSVSQLPGHLSSGVTARQERTPGLQQFSSCGARLCAERQPQQAGNSKSATGTPHSPAFSNLAAADATRTRSGP